MYWNNMSTFECVAIAAAAGGSDAQPRGRPRREAPTGQVTEGGGHRRSRRGDAATIATAASAIPVAAALCAQAIVNIVEAVCGDILVARVERQTESTHFTCRVAARILCAIVRKAANAQRLETVGTKWIAGIRTNFSLKSTLTMLLGPIPASSLTSRRWFWRRFPELFKGEDQQLA